VTLIRSRRIGWAEKKLQIPRLPPDFLSGSVASFNPVRLSFKKAAYVAVDECCVVGNPEFARDDKIWGSLHTSKLGWADGKMRRTALSRKLCSPDLPDSGSAMLRLQRK
jgi:hypothetical protein